MNHKFVTPRLHKAVPSIDYTPLTQQCSYCHLDYVLLIRHPELIVFVCPICGNIDVHNISCADLL